MQKNIKDKIPFFLFTEMIIFPLLPKSERAERVLWYSENEWRLEEYGHI